MSESEIQARVAHTRATLENTLDAIEDKLNLPKRAAELGQRAQASYEKNPTPWLVGAIGVVGAAVGLVIWALSNDD
ncbi:DUF3618 domain-containing protein [Galbitalea soli]|uniref:DUF3618 domain-containing protein n=1 Tax=Galbitalea soli TaxID=1268042 RepID=A0A7C9PPZ1_9MICO|nr:DUF3618 domain-containing protein [Galbitalea soli]NEM92451.1 DUF3618 domain-containing protein [Galbitalea soli]NYJ29486.1 hypothetical protein [Galbitalea soli]